MTSILPVRVERKPSTRAHFSHTKDESKQRGLSIPLQHTASMVRAPRASSLLKFGGCNPPKAYWQQRISNFFKQAWNAFRSPFLPIHKRPLFQAMDKKFNERHEQLLQHLRSVFEFQHLLIQRKLGDPTADQKIQRLKERHKIDVATIQKTQKELAALMQKVQQRYRLPQNPVIRHYIEALNTTPRQIEAEYGFARLEARLIQQLPDAPETLRATQKLLPKPEEITDEESARNFGIKFSLIQ